MSVESLLATALRNHLSGSKPNVPEAGVLFWNLFMEISASRTYHAAGPNPISYTEIEAYARLHRWPLAPHHVALIRALDDVWLEHAYKQSEVDHRNGAEIPHHIFDSRRYANAQPITANSFDAVFG